MGWSLLTCHLAALLHDVGDHKYFRPEEGFKRLDGAVQQLCRAGLPNALGARILSVVDGVSFSKEMKLAKKRQRDAREKSTRKGEDEGEEKRRKEREEEEEEGNKVTAGRKARKSMDVTEARLQEGFASDSAGGEEGERESVNAARHSAPKPTSSATDPGTNPPCSWSTTPSSALQRGGGERTSRKREEDLSKEGSAKVPTEGAAISRELAVVQDADRLDAMGAIGIARCFTFGGGRPAQESVAHFHVKLLRLKGLMKTEEGRRRAEKRHQIMLDFLDQLSGEEKGER